MAVIQVLSSIDELFSAREYAFQERRDLLCVCGCDHPKGLCTCVGAPHEYEPSGVRIEECERCGLPNVPDHPCR